jgi:hypothetical protein
MGPDPAKVLLSWSLSPIKTSAALVAAPTSPIILFDQSGKPVLVNGDQKSSLRQPPPLAARTRNCQTLRLPRRLTQTSQFMVWIQFRTKAALFLLEFTLS